MKIDINKRIKLKIRLLVPVLISFFIIILISYSLTINYLEDKNKLSRDLLVSQFQEIFARLTSKNAKTLFNMIEFIKSDKKNIELWKTRDRTGLYNNNKLAFKRLNKTFNLTHFYFIKKNGTCFLRVHKPEKHGDLISRYTLLSAKKKMIPIYGIELGVFRNITLRAVYPWYFDGKLQGYIELGFEIDKIIESIAGMMQVDIFISVKKSLLNYNNYQLSIKNTNKKNNWNKYKNFLVINKAVEKTPAGLDIYIEQENKKKTNELEIRNQLFSVSPIPFIDVIGNNIGSFIILKNLTEKKKIRADWIKTQTLLILLIGIILLLIFWYYIGILEKSFEKNRKNFLENEKEMILLKRSIEQSVDGFAISAMDGTIIFVNKSWAEMHNQSVDYLFGKHLSVLHTKEQLENEVIPFNKKVIEKGSNQGEINHKRNDDTIFPTWMSVTVSKDPEGNPDGLVAVCRDISEQKILQSELLDAKIRAEEATIAKSEFLANMSHEIRTPMNGVIGMTELLLDTPLDPEQKDYALTVRKSAENLLTIINNILDFSKIEAGKLDIELIDFNLTNLINDIERLFLQKAVEKNLKFIIDIDKNIPEKVIGDPGRIKQILLNLLGNGFKFTDKGEIQLLLNIENTTNNLELLVRFSIIDTGTGIEKEKISTLFDSFTQADASTTRKYGGTGLGLAICKQLTELMGGKLNAESIVGKGSKFHFTLKFKIPENDTVYFPPKTLHKVNQNRILIIANDETNLLILGKMLKSWGFNYSKAQNVETAIKKLRDESAKGNPFNIAVIDVNMPGMTGEELGVNIKQDKIINDTNLIMITSTAQRGDGLRLLKIGFSAYLPKPIRQSELYDCLILIANKHENKSINRNLENKLITKYIIAEFRDSNKKLLLVEDNIINQKYALKLLKKMGLEVDIAENGAESLKAIEKKDYDLIIMDIQMPVMNGYEATKEIRKLKNKKKSNIPIIAMTANAMNDDRAKCLDAGMDDYISKPIKPGILKEIILRNLR